MRHLDEGTILEIRDGALVPADARIHAGECSSCADALTVATQRAGVVGDLLDLLDRPVDVGGAKARVRARLDARRAAEEPKRALYLPLGRAAAILLFAAGAAWAVPGSPVRDWISDTDGTASFEGATLDPASPQALEGGGIEVEMPAGGIVIALSSVDGRSDVRLDWVDRPVARISAAAGSTYAFAEGRAEADVAPGAVVLEVARSASSVTIEINGRLVFAGTAESPTVTDADATRTGDGLLFPAAAR